MGKQNTKLKRGGKRPFSGAKQKYGEKTKTIAFRVPESKTDEMRFNSEDIKKWQEQANLTTGGNLTLWMENTLNNAVKKQNIKPKQ